MTKIQWNFSQIFFEKEYSGIIILSDTILQNFIEFIIEIKL